jgi:hypothetical protein
MAAKRKSPEESLRDSINALNKTIKEQNSVSERLEKSFGGFAMWNAQDSLYEVFSHSITFQTRSLSLGKTALQVQQENNDNLKALNTGLSIKLEEQLNALESGIHGDLKGTLQLATRMSALGESTNLLWAAMSQQRSLLNMSNRQMDDLAEAVTYTAESFSINREKLVGALSQLTRNLAGLSLATNIEGVQLAQTALLGQIGAAFSTSLPQALGPIFEVGFDSMARDIRTGTQEEIRRLTSGGADPGDIIKIFQKYLDKLEYFTGGITDPQLLKATTERAATFLNVTAENLAIMRSIVSQFESGQQLQKSEAGQAADAFKTTFAEFQSKILTPLMQVLMKATDFLTNVVTEFDGLIKAIGYTMAATTFGVMGKSTGAWGFRGKYGLGGMATGLAGMLMKSIPVLGTGIMIAEMAGIDVVGEALDLVGGESTKQTDLMKRDAENQEKQARVATATLKEIEKQNKDDNDFEGKDIHSLNKELINRMFLMQTLNNDKYDKEKARYQQDLILAQQEEIAGILKSIRTKMGVISKKGPIK